jgi:uncharacterized protein (TIGR02466 family)
MQQLNEQNDFRVLFGTPVWTFWPIDDVDNFNTQLYKECNSYDTGMNVFDMHGEAITRLREVVKKHSFDIAKQYKWNKMPSFFHARQNPIFPNKHDTPHFHLGSKLIALYYMRVPENSGDLLIHDVRGWNDWPDPEAITEHSGKTCRAYHRITPKEGMLVFHPSYAVHSVETNLSDKQRISIAMSIL